MNAPGESLGARARQATAWSFATELAARLIAPVTQLILARLLAPEAFGLVATIVLVTSFAEMLADAGFQKYLVQHEFDDEEELSANANVAFWSSMALALVLLLLILVFRDPLAAAVGSPGAGWLLVVASLSLPLTVFSATHRSLLRRGFAYKRMMPIRVGSALVLLATAVPLAIAGFDFWSLIIGSLASAASAAIGFAVISPWRPRFTYSFRVLREMFSFSGWSLLEAVSIWLTTWAGTFIVATFLTTHEVGLYRQPMTIVNSLFGLVTAATTPILFAALSRLQRDPVAFRAFFLRFQFGIALVVLPIGVVVFAFRDIVTEVVLGPQWTPGALMLGAWSLSTAVAIIFSHYCSEVYRALGKPRVSLVSQLIYMSVMIPVMVVAAGEGFVALVVAASVVRIAAIAINQVITFVVARIGFWSVLRNVAAPLLAVVLAGALALWLAEFTAGDVAMSAVAMAVVGLAYLGVCLCFPVPRALVRSALRRASTTVTS